MGLVGVELTSFVGTNNPLGIAYYGGPVKTLLESFAN
jgi:hypothetical protein